MRPELDDFQVVSKIDRIRIDAHKRLPGRGTPGVRSALARAFQGKLNLPSTNSATWLTLHDATVKDVQLLVDEFHEAEVHILEVTADFIPLNEAGSANLQNLYEWLRHSLCPQRHWRMQKVKRSQWCDHRRTVVRLKPLEVLPNLQTFYWSDTTGYCQVRLYIKQDADDAQVRQSGPFVRVEVTLNRGGTQQANVLKVGMIPHFAKRLRKNLAAFFSVGEAAKPATTPRIGRIKTESLRQKTIAKQARCKAELVSNWERYGSAYVLHKRLPFVPDRDANERIETALKRLGEKLMRLRAPQKVAHFDEWIARQVVIHKDYFGTEPPSYRKTPRATA